MLINLVLFQPPGFEHGRVFDEVMLLYAASLRNLGHRVEQSVNRFSSEGLNLLFAWHLMPPEVLPELEGLDYVVLQLEGLAPVQIAAETQRQMIESRLALLRQAREIWDYAPENLAVLASYGLSARLMPLGFHPLLERYAQWPRPDKDVLFLGSMTPRREKILFPLQERCRFGWLFGNYGPERDQLIARCRLVLNLHAHDHLQQLEQVRVFDLFANRMLVISESCSWQPYGPALRSYDYEAILDGVLDWLARPARELQQAADEGHEALRRIPFRANLEQALTALD